MAKVIFSEVCVKNSVHRGGSVFGPLGGLLLVPRGVSAFGLGGGLQAHSQGGSLGGSGPGLQPRGKLRGIWSRTTPKGKVEDVSPRETATAAAGTHPTGMHSCFSYKSDGFIIKCAKLLQIT